MTRRNLFDFTATVLGSFGFGFLADHLAVHHSFPIAPIAMTEGWGTAAHPYEDRLATGPLDDIPSTSIYAKRQIVGYLKTRLPGSTCDRCDIPYGIGQWHTLYYLPDRGRSSMCEQCWQELQVPNERLPYYIKSSRQAGHTEEDIELIRAAVLAGR